MFTFQCRSIVQAFPLPSARDMCQSWENSTKDLALGMLHPDSPAAGIKCFCFHCQPFTALTSSLYSVQERKYVSEILERLLMSGWLPLSDGFGSYV